MSNAPLPSPFTIYTPSHHSALTLQTSNFIIHYSLFDIPLFAPCPCSSHLLKLLLSVFLFQLPTSNLQLRYSLFIIRYSALRPLPLLITLAQTLAVSSPLPSSVFPRLSPKASVYLVSYSFRDKQRQASSVFGLLSSDFCLLSSDFGLPSSVHILFKSSS